MTFYLQVCPTGIYPHTIVENTNECWIFRFNDSWDKAEWHPVTAKNWPRYMAGHGTEFIPEVHIESSKDDLEVSLEVRRALSQRPDSGAFGIQTRGLYGLPAKGRDTPIYMGLFGFIWHPDPRAFANCKAQERGQTLVAMQTKTFKEPGLNLAWTEYPMFDDLWQAIPRSAPQSHP